MIIGEIAREQPVQVSLAEHDDVVQTFAADRTNQPFDIRRLPRGAWRNPEFLQSQCQSACLEFEAVDAIAISEEVFRRRRERKRLAQLLGSPTGLSRPSEFVRVW